MQEAWRHNRTAITSQQVVAQLRALELVAANRKLKPISQWSAQQKSDIVKFMRGRSGIVSSRPSYTDEGTFMSDMHLTEQV